MSDNLAIIAAAGARKTQHLVDTSLSASEASRVLLSAYTTENQQEITNRVSLGVGVVPSNITVTGWMGFLINECAKPYQRAITGKPFAISGFNFDGEPGRFIRKDNSRYFLDSDGRLYRRNLSDFVFQLNQLTEGAVISRIEKLFSHILIDEAQDLVGWDLEVLELLMQADVDLTLVADPRQHTYATNNNPKNKGKGGANLMDWVQDRSSMCTIEERTDNYRCNQDICDLANTIYPEMAAATSAAEEYGGHSGIHFLKRSEVEAYCEEVKPQVLQHSKNSNTLDLPAVNFGNSKGREYDHVLVFPTGPVRQFLKENDPFKLAATSRAKLYVAVTRARHSVAFVTD